MGASDGRAGGDAEGEVAAGGQQESSRRTGDAGLGLG
jgi:hypothetical protein